MDRHIPRTTPRPRKNQVIEPNRPWTRYETELLIALSNGPRVTAPEIRRGLTAAGFLPRTTDAINTQRRHLGVGPNQYKRAERVAKKLAGQIDKTPRTVREQTINEIWLFKQWVKAVFPGSPV